VGSRWRECDQAGAPVSRVSADVHIAEVLELAYLSGNEGWMDFPLRGDLRRADLVAPSDDLEQAKGAGPLALTCSPLDAADQGEQGDDHRLYVAFARGHRPMVVSLIESINYREVRSWTSTPGMDTGRALVGVVGGSWRSIRSGRLGGTANGPRAGRSRRSWSPVAILGDVTIDLSQVKSSPSGIDINAYASAMWTSSSATVTR